MKRILAAIFLCISLLSGNSGRAAETSDYSLDTHLGYGYSDIAGESVQEVLRLAPGFHIKFSPRTKVVFDGRLRLDFADKLEPGKVNTGAYSTLSRPAVVDNVGTAEFRDAYVEHMMENGLLRVGKQQIVWGRLDGLKVLDVLNPQDLREFILDDFGESRISLWSAYLDVTLGGWRTELALIPDNTGHAVPAPGAWFELTASRYRYGANPGDPTPPAITRRESISADTSAYALKLSRQTGALEIGAMAYSGMDHEPLGRLFDVDGETIVERYYERRDLFGLHVETSTGSVVIRGEVAMQPNRSFNIRTPSGLSAVALDQFTAGIGLDIDGPWGTFVNIQYLHDQVHNGPTELVRPETDRILTLFLRRSFSYENVILSARYFRSQERGDDMFTLAAEFLFDDATSLRLAADAFDGNSAGIFGQFSDRDRITIGLTHTF